MGASGRPMFKLRTARDCIEYFIHSIEAWMRETNLDEPVVIVAHSLGANISTEFSLRYAHRVSKLILLSPAGIPEAPRD